MTITQLRTPQPPVRRDDPEIAMLSREVAEHLRGISCRLEQVEDALAGLRVARGGIIDRMVTFVAFSIGVKPIELLSERRTRHLSYGRFAVMWGAGKLTTYSLPRIGEALGGYDHTSVLHGQRRAEELRETDAEFRRLTDALLDRFSLMCGTEETPPCMP